MTEHTPNLGLLYRLGEGLTRSARFEPYSVLTNQPEDWRRLQVFALDPSVSRLDGAVATVRIPCETLEPGPVSQLFRVDMSAPDEATCYRCADLDAAPALRSDGVAADQADPAFHAQMVYAIGLLTYEAFRKALGRHIVWGFEGERRGSAAPLILRPFGMRRENAYYSRDAKAVCFGYFNPPPADGYSDPTHVFTSLSCDIITHEVSHALLDGLRPYFREATNPDVLAFHEAFADLIAIFQRFTFKEMLCAQLQKARGYLGNRTLLRMLAPEFGQALGRAHGLRTFEVALQQAAAGRGAGEEPEIVALHKLSEDEAGQPHERGRVLAEAVFDAFATIVKRKTDPLVGLATNGTGRLPEGNLPAHLLDEMVHATRRVADQFRAICIRAIDYCPPVDLEFGDYLRALITADRELVRDDPYGYREAIVDAFRRRGIFPLHVRTMSETALAWAGPQRVTPPIAGLGLSDLRFEGDPAVPLDRAEVHRRACILGEAITATDGLMAELGLVPPGDGFDLPEIVSIRPARRVGPDGQVAFDLVAEIVQTRHLSIAGRDLPMRGGATVIIDSLGQIRFVVRKRVDHEERADELRKFVTSAAGQAFWSDDPEQDVFRRLCFGGREPAGGPQERPRDAVAQTFVQVRHPIQGAQSFVEIDFGAFAIPTGRAEPLPVGRHRFDLRVDGAPFAADVVCPAGFDLDAPFGIDLEPA